MTIILLYYNGIKAVRVYAKQLYPIRQTIVPNEYDKDYG